MKPNLITRVTRLTLASAALAAYAAVGPPPAAASDPRAHPACHTWPDRRLVWAEALEAAKQAHPGHDGHILPPTPQELADSQAAQVRLQAVRPLIPCDGRRDHGRR